MGSAPEFGHRRGCRQLTSTDLCAYWSLWSASVAYLACASPAFAQRFTFDGSFDAALITTLDVSTQRGSISVVAGSSDRVQITAVVTARLPSDSPANSVELAQQVAKAPPIERDGSTIRLHPPTDSGATTIRGLTGPVRVHTESAAIDLGALKGPVSVTTGSGAVSADDLSGALTVTTSSSGLTSRRIASSLHVRTESGEVDAELTGNGDVDVETARNTTSLRPEVRAARTCAESHSDIDTSQSP